MTNNKRDLKPFVRIDGSGRTVPNSLIFRKSKPKIGRWYEVTNPDLCCGNTTTTSTTSLPCATYIAFAVRESVVLTYVNCLGEIITVPITSSPHRFCALIGQYGTSGPATVLLTSEDCYACYPQWYFGALTVGTGESTIGYAAGEGGFGTINPLENNIVSIVYHPDDDWFSVSVVGETCAESLKVFINTEEYELPLDTAGELTVYTQYLVGSNPLPTDGETCYIQICFVGECTTTTTTTVEES